MSDELSGLRVAIVTDISPDERSRYWIETLAALGAIGIQPYLVTVRDPGALHREAAAVTAGRLALAARRSRNYPAAALRLRAFAHAEGIDVVHASEPIPGLISALARGIRAGRQSWFFQRRHVTTNWKQDLFTAIASARADRVLSISRTVTRAVLADHVNPAKLREVGNGVVTPIPAAASRDRDRARFGIGAEDFAVACVARIRAGKGHDVLIEACRRVEQRGCLGERPLHLVLIGDGPEATAITRLAARCSEFTTHLTGWVDDTERWMAIADVVAVPSLSEPFGKAAVEAMALGVPLVASRVGGLADLLDGDRNGVGVSPGDPDALAAAIATVLCEQDLTRTRAAAARVAYETHYSIAAMVERWEAVYAEISR